MKKKEVARLIETWSEKGVISTEQARQMTFDLADYTSKRSGEKFISAVMYIGATALSLGALLLIASNWSQLPRGIKLVLTILLPIIPLSFAYWQLVLRGQNKVLGRAANILAMVLVGGSLALIGQIYNLDANMVMFFWTWAVLTAPFIAVFKRAENVLFSAVMIGVASGYSLVDFLENTNIDDSTAILLFTAATLLYGYILYAIGSLIRPIETWEGNARLLRIGGALVAAVTLFITTFKFYAQIVTNNSYGIFSGQSAGEWVALSLVLNIIFIVFLVIMLIRSVKYEEYGLAFSVVRFFGLYMIVKYVELFYSMFDTGLFLLIGGIIFITGGWMLEKHKKHLISYMKSPSDNPVQNYDK